MKKVLLSVGLLGLLGIGLMSTKADAAEVVENGVRYHQVESNETISTISQNYGLDMYTFYNANADQVSDINLIFEGQKLLIPDGTTPVVVEAQEPTEEVYVAQETYVEPAAAPVYQEQAPVAQAPVAAQGGSAKEWIAQKESGGSYDATNGQYIGRYQLTSSYLNGDYSPENQERVADQYVTSRYGSWEGAQAFWMANGWY